VSARVRRAWRACERFAEGPYAAASVVGAALAVYALVSLALPLAAGRDLARYLLVYAQLFDERVVYPHALLTRTPVAPLVAGGLADLGPLAAEATTTRWNGSSAACCKSWVVVHDVSRDRPPATGWERQPRSTTPAGPKTAARQ